MRLGDRGAMRRRTPNSRLSDQHSLERCPLRAAFALSAAQNRPRHSREAVSMTNPTNIATWNPERVAQLRNFVGAGLTCSQIAAEIGVTRNAVIGKIHRLGLGPGRPAAAPGRACPPRTRRPRLPSQRQMLRLISADAPRTANGAAVDSAPVDSAQHCSLLELAQGKCRWPVSDPGSNSG